jgi:hypothetical protein
MSLLLFTRGGGSGTVEIIPSVPVSAMPTIVIETILAGETAWTDITDDVASDLSLRYGIQGNGPLHRVASTGDLDFQLFNDANNSGKKLGWYSPAHANKRTGWDFDRPVRAVFTPQPAREVTSLSKVLTTATATTAGPHGLATGDYVTIAGAFPTLFNGIHQVTVLDPLTYTFQVPV